MQCAERLGFVLLFLQKRKRERGHLLRKTAAAPAAHPPEPTDRPLCATRRQSLVLAKAKGRYGDAAFCVCFFLCAAFWLSIIPSLFT